MPDRRARVAALLLLFLLTAPLALAQAAPPPEAAAPDSATELTRIRAALERIAASLERQNEGQRAELAMRRLDMESRAAERLEGEIAKLADRRGSLEDERFHMQSQLLAIAKQAEASDAVYTPEEVASLREQFELQIGLLEARIGEIDRRTQELSNQLAEHRDTARGWQALIDRHLQNEWAGNRKP